MKDPDVKAYFSFKNSGNPRHVPLWLREGRSPDVLVYHRYRDGCSNLFLYFISAYVCWFQPISCIFSNKWRRCVQNPKEGAFLYGCIDKLSPVLISFVYPNSNNDWQLEVLLSSSKDSAEDQEMGSSVSQPYGMFQNLLVSVIFHN